MEEKNCYILKKLIILTLHINLKNKLKKIFNKEKIFC